MLKQRILTAVILVPAVLWILSTSLPYVFAAFTALVLLLASWEWAGLLGFHNKNFKIAYLFFVAFVFGITLLLPLGLNLVIALVGWVWMFLAVISHSLGKQFLWLDKIPLRFILGAPLLVVAWLSINVLRQEPEGLAWTLYVLVLVWLADISAYFAGKYLGKHRLVPRVSPNKTWEGALAALISSQLFTFCALPWLPIYWDSWRIFPIALATVIFAIFGDLVESLLKRIAHVKDSGTLLPGHGGVLDRIDSLIAALPVFVLLRLGMF